MLNELSNIIATENSSVDDIFTPLVKLYPLSFIHDYKYISNNNLLAFLLRLQDHIIQATLFPNPADTYGDIISLRLVINNRVNALLHELQVQAEHQRSIYVQISHFIDKYSSNISLELEYFDKLCHELKELQTNQELTPRYKVRMHMRLGCKYLLFKILFKIKHGPLQPLTEMDTIACERLTEILTNIRKEITDNLPEQSIVYTDDFGYFAETALIYGEHIVVIDAVNYGARLYDDPYFLNIIPQVQHNNDTLLYEALTTLTTDPDKHHKLFVQAISDLNATAYNNLLAEHRQLTARHWDAITAKLSSFRRKKEIKKRKSSTPVEPYIKFVQNIDLKLTELVKILENKDVDYSIKKPALVRCLNTAATEWIEHLDLLDLDKHLEDILDPIADQDIVLKKLYKELQSKIKEECLQKPEYILKAVAGKNLSFSQTIIEQLVTNRTFKDLPLLNQALEEYSKHNRPSDLKCERHPDLLCVTIYTQQYSKFKLLLDYKFPVNRLYPAGGARATIAQIMIGIASMHHELLKSTIDALRYFLKKFHSTRKLILQEDTRGLTCLEYVTRFNITPQNIEQITELVTLLLENDIEIKLAPNANNNVLHAIAETADIKIFSLVADYIVKTMGKVFLEKLLKQKNAQLLDPVACTARNKFYNVNNVLANYMRSYLKVDTKKSTSTTLKFDNSEHFNRFISENPTEIDTIFARLNTDEAIYQNEDVLLGFLMGIYIPIKHFAEFFENDKVSAKIKAALLTKLFDNVKFDEYSQLWALHKKVNLLDITTKALTTMTSDCSLQVTAVCCLLKHAEIYDRAQSSTDNIYLANLSKWANDTPDDLAALTSELYAYTCNILELDISNYKLYQWLDILHGLGKTTFLHALIKNSTPENALNALRIIFENDFPGLLELAVFARDEDGNNLYCLLEYKTAEWNAVRDFIIDLIIKFYRELYSKHKSITSACPGFYDFYNMNRATDVLATLLAGKNYSQVLLVLNTRFILASKLKIGLYNIEREKFRICAGLPEELKAAFANINLVFGKDYLNSYIYCNQKLLNFLVKTLTPVKDKPAATDSIYAEYISSTIYRITMRKISILQTSFWDDLVRLINSRAKQSDIYTAMHKILALIQKHDININKTFDDTSALRQAIIRDELYFLKFICEDCSADIDQATMLWSLTLVYDISLETYEYLKSKYKSDFAALIKEHNTHIILKAVYNNCGTNRIEWLIKQGCDPTAMRHDSKTILHIFIDLITQESTTFTLERLFNLTECLFEKLPASKQLLAIKDKSGLRFCDYLAKLSAQPSDREILDKLIKLSADDSITASSKPKF